METADLLAALSTRSKRRPGGERLRERVDGDRDVGDARARGLARKRPERRGIATPFEKSWRRIARGRENECWATRRRVGSNGETRASRDAGVRWQVYAQASIVMDAAPPDLEAGAAALDARRDAPKPPGGYPTWAEALRAWTDWGRGRGPASGPARGVGGRAVPVASARALLAVGRHGINWNFDDWHGYAAERERFLRAVVPNANRALILGGDSHDAWAGIVPADPAGWGARGANGIRGDIAVGAVEFDVPGVTPPGAFEHEFPWCPTELIDEGHLAANGATMRFVKTGRRGFAMLVAARSRRRRRGFHLHAASVRDETYAPECGGSFVASGDSDGNVRLSRRACPPLPRRLRFEGDGGGTASSVVGETATLVVVAVVFGILGGAALSARRWRGRSAVGSVAEAVEPRDAEGTTRSTTTTTRRTRARTVEGDVPNRVMCVAPLRRVVARSRSSPYCYSRRV